MSCTFGVYLDYPYLDSPRHCIIAFTSLQRWCRLGAMLQQPRPLGPPGAGGGAARRPAISAATGYRRRRCPTSVELPKAAVEYTRIWRSWAARYILFTY